VVLHYSMWDVQHSETLALQDTIRKEQDVVTL